MKFRFWMSLLYTVLLVFELLFMAYDFAVGRSLPVGDFVILAVLGFVACMSWYTFLYERQAADRTASFVSLLLPSASPRSSVPHHWWQIHHAGS